MGQFGEDYYNSLTMEDVAEMNETYGTSLESVYDMVHYWHPDHNHYIQPLANVLATYILGEVAKIADADKQEEEKPKVSVIKVAESTSEEGLDAVAYAAEWTQNRTKITDLVWTLTKKDDASKIYVANDNLEAEPNIASGTPVVRGIVFKIENLNEIDTVSAVLN